MEAPKYHGSIYKIQCNKTGKVYIGRTIVPIETRIYKHVCAFNQWKNGDDVDFIASFEVMELEDYTYEILENVAYDDANVLKGREGDWIASTKCVNKSKTLTTEEIAKTKGLSYRETYKLTGRSAAYKKKYRDGLPEETKQKQYLAWKKSKSYKVWFSPILCDCGSTMTKASAPKHFESGAHLRNLAKRDRIKKIEAIEVAVEAPVEEIKELWILRNKKVNCECGSIVNDCYLKAHMTTKKHLKKMALIEPK